MHLLSCLSLSSGNNLKVFCGGILGWLVCYFPKLPFSSSMLLEPDCSPPLQFGCLTLLATALMQALRCRVCQTWHEYPLLV